MARRSPGEDGAGRDLVQLRIDAIAAGGDGVGRDVNGRVVFVPLTAPGDLVRAELTTRRKRWARGRLRELLEAAPERRPAPCPVFGTCGGCRLQHLPEDEQAPARRQVVAAALVRIGGLDVEVPPLVRAGEPLGYRNRVTLTVRREALGKAGAAAGFHALHEPARVVDCPNCLLAEAPVRAAWDALAPLSDLPAGEELRVTIRASAAGRVALLVEGGGRGPDLDAGEPAALAARIPGLECYWWIDGAGTRRRLAGRDTFAESWRGVDFELDPTVFLQVNRRVSAAMDEWIEAEIAGRLGPLEGRRVIDLYAGVGARPISWASAGARVTTVEIDGAACAATRRATAAGGVELEIVEGRAEDHLDRLRADLVVVNPPRAGLARPVRDALAAGPAGEVVYVSCDPATLARDLARLTATSDGGSDRASGGAYEVAALQPFDAFPQTAHVETIAWLSRRDEVALPDPAAGDTEAEAA